ncbi:small integral membrane protein 22 [Anomaloglossus baeobatrachus]|uniref:small integral membrane protein 22 n=1 Tax=Anomaloglossus baeobatrachus TaxID=238106 RepID=UPI003F4FBDFD
MSSNNIGQQLEDQWNDVLGRLATKQMFQSNWDIAAFAIFFVFIGLILLLILLVLIRCCCCCCCDCDSPVDKRKYKQKVGVDNLAMEP